MTEIEEVEMYVNKKASILVSDFGKDGATGMLLLMLADAILRKGAFENCTEEKNKESAMMTLSILTEVLAYEQVG